jgi:hypothetical protein
VNDKEILGLIDEYNYKFGVDKSISLLLNKLSELQSNKNEILKGKTKLFKNEEELKKWIIKYLEHDFYIYSEVSGLLEGCKVRIDFVLYPREHLVIAGFVKEPFGIEVKHFPLNSKFTHKASRAFWQTISYKK